MHAGALDGAAGARLGGAEQSESLVERTRLVAGLRRGKRPPGGAPGLWRQLGGAPQKGSGGGQTAPRLSPARRPLELGGNILPGAGRGLSKVPGAPVRVDLRVGRLRQRAVRLPSPLGRCRPVDRRTHQRMAKAHPAVDLDQASRLRRLERRGRDPEPLGRPSQQRGITERLRRGDQQKTPGLRREGPRPLTKLSSILPDNDSAPGNPNPPASCAAVSPRGSSSSASGFPRRLGQEPVGDPLVQPPRDDRHQQRPRIGTAKTLDHQLRHTAEQIARLPRREQHHHRLRHQPSRDERESLRGRPVQPLGIVHHTQDRAPLRGLRQQTQDGQADEQAIRHHPGVQPERCLKRIALRTREPIKPIEQRRAQLVKRRERQLHLRLHPVARRTLRSGAEAIA